MVIIHAGRGPGGHGPLKGLLTIRIGQDAVVLVQLIQGERGHLALHGPIFLGAVEGGEVHRAGDDLLRVALGDAVQIDAVEVGAEGADGKVIAEAKLALDPLHVHEQGAILAVLQDDAGLPPVEDDLAGERCGKRGFSCTVPPLVVGGDGVPLHGLVVLIDGAGAGPLILTLRADEGANQLVRGPVIGGGQCSISTLSWVSPPPFRW